MEKADFKEYVNIIEDKAGIQFSDEQKAVLWHNCETPTLINSCAGAGKTTLIMYMIILQMLDGDNASSKLVVTFSKNAQLDMGRKFTAIMNKLGFNFSETPQFRTFDSLFLELLKLIQPDVKVLAGANMKRQTYRIKQEAIAEYDDVLSDAELIKQIDEYRALLINSKFTDDGYDFHVRETSIDSLKKFDEKLKIRHSDKFYVNYLNVTKVYLNYKRDHHLYDFDDIKIELLHQMTTTKNRQIIEKKMAPYQNVFIDEFQDINSLQWELINQLVSDHTKEHLTMIGDDDQSIYQFRGSDPEIILNLWKNVPNLETFNLTINYRTAGNILKHVKPLIEHNKYRLAKQLRSFNQDGQLIEFVGNENAKGGKLLLDNVLKKLKDPDVQNGDIAILCRNNIDITLANDYLSTFGEFLNVKNVRNILQSDKYYHGFVQLMESLYYNNFNTFYKNANLIGFRSYQTHIEAVLSASKQKSFDKLSDYLSEARIYDGKNLSSQNWADRNHLDNDNQMTYLLQNVQYQIQNPGNIEIGRILGDTLMKLTKTYVEYMRDHHYIDINKFCTVRNYLVDKLKPVTNFKQFITDEITKKNTMKSIIDNDESDTNQVNSLKKATFLTMHGSKGLEFKYVYVYNARANQTTSFNVDLNRVYAPNITREQFLNSLLAGTWHQFKTIPDARFLVEYAEDLDTQLAIHNKKHDLQKFKDSLIGRVSYKKYKSDVDEFLKIYNQVKVTSQNVEDERRLVYVALTRSKQYAYYNQDNTLGFSFGTTPLLAELTTPDSQQIMEDDHGKLVDSKTIYANKSYSKEAKLRFDRILNQK